MKITIAAMGKMKKCPEKDIIQSYLKRISWKISIKELVETRPLPTKKLKQSEAKLLMHATPSGSKKIALDENGKKLTSKEFAEKIEKWKNEGDDLSFLIGGADGHDESTLEQVDFTLSLGRMTWPHMLARLMLVEQLYRAYSILAGHPYHRD